jgi:3-hydroxyacyl-[acyl-carrier-protein] dehydratase
LNSLDIYRVLDYLPHRYPFLLIDRVLDCTPGESLLALKNVTINEPFFQGHFPGHPVMPGVLVIEAMAQACGILSFQTDATLPGSDKVYLFVGIDKARFKRQVVPGDQLHFHVTVARRIHGMWKFQAEARVEGEVAASAELMCTFKDRE